jgi:hypothetical protein
VNGKILTIWGTASVIGYHFDLPTLVEIFPAGGNQKKFLKGELDVLVRLQIIKVTSIMPGSEAFRFINPSFLEVRFPLALSGTSSHVL